ncbi:MAG: membrane protein insertion efficiency factor YidD [Patescibacteria group bacterium]
MSQVIIFLIRAYQAMISPLLHTAFGPTGGCRYELSCSEYSIRSLRRLGLVDGGVASVRRLLTCHP